MNKKYEIRQADRLKKQISDTELSEDLDEIDDEEDLGELDF